MSVTRVVVVLSMLLSLSASAEEKAQPVSFEAAKPAPGATTAKAEPELDVSRMPFDAHSIQQVVKFHMKEVQACYEQVLADSGKKIEGKVVIAFVVDTHGAVSEARVLSKKTTLHDERVQDCVLAMRRWAFPKPSDNRDHPMEYPFNLKVQK